MLRLLALPAALALAAAGAAAAPARTGGDVNVPKALSAQLERVAPRTDVPIRLPAIAPLGFDGRVYGAGSGTRRAYELELAGAPRCGGANACFLALFQGERGGTPAFRRTVRLTGGRVGWFKPTSCGASCSPPMIQWRQGRYLYSLQAKVAASGDAERRAMVGMANSAIRRAPR